MATKRLAFAYGRALVVSRLFVWLVLTGLVVGLGLFSWLGIQSVKENTAKVLDERLIIAKMMAGVVVL